MGLPLTDRIARIAADILEVPAEAIHLASSPDTVPNWDSIRHLNLVLGLEQEFGIQFTPEEIEQLLSVELIASLVDEKLRECGATLDIAETT